MILTTTLLIVIVTVVVCGGSTLSLLTWLGIPLGVNAGDGDDESAPITADPERRRYNTVRVEVPPLPAPSATNNSSSSSSSQVLTGFLSH